MKPKSILLEAEEIINGPRAAQYGPIRADYTAVGGIFGAAMRQAPEKPEIGVFRMVCVKIARIGMILLGLAPYQRDSFVDACGYLAKLAAMLEGVE